MNKNKITSIILATTMLLETVPVVNAYDDVDLNDTSISIENIKNEEENYLEEDSTNRIDTTDAPQNNDIDNSNNINNDSLEESDFDINDNPIDINDFIDNSNTSNGELEDIVNSDCMEDEIKEDVVHDEESQDIFLDKEDDDVIVDTDVVLNENTLPNPSMEIINDNLSVDESSDELIVENKSIIEDNWLNREVARQVYGNENSYNQLTENDYLKVRVINMSNKQLNSEIPKDIGKLRNLEELVLYRCNLTGTIPKSIGNLTNLVNLDLSMNSLTGEIPESIGNLSNVRWLYLFDNNLSGVIPESIGNLTNLEYLGLYENSLTGEIPESIGNLTNLVWLDLGFNSLTGEIPESIGNLSNLEELSLYENNLTGAIPESIGNLTNLQYLYLYANNLSGRIPGFIYNINYLRIDNNNFIGNVPENAKSKFGNSAFENNLFNNVSNQKYMEFIGTDDICLNVGDQANLHNLNDNIKLYNYDGTVYSDTYNLNYPLEYVCDTSILDENFIALRKGSTNVSAKIADTDIISKNDILVDVRDNINPTIDAIVSTTEYINGDVEISIKASDNDAIDKIILPDGSETKSTEFVFTVSNNGKYVFTAVDRSGNTSSKTVDITNIDRVLPTINLTTNTIDWTNKNIDINVNISDNGKVVKTILPDGTESKLANLVYTVSSNGKYTFKSIDSAGNVSEKTIVVDRIDTTKPILKLNTSKLKSDNTIDIIIEANDTESGIKEILLSDGTRLDLNNPKINVSENGIYKFIVTDNVGNITESIININNINDKNNDISKIPNAGGFTSLIYLSSLITIAGSYSLLRKRKND